MSSISIVGLGNMATAMAGRALAGGNAVEMIGRDSAKAKELAADLGGVTVGTPGATPAGDIVIIAVPYAAAAAVVGEYGDALDGKVVVDITNPMTPDFTSFVTPEGSFALGNALAGTGKPLVAAGSMASAGHLGRPATEDDPALPGGDAYRGTLRFRNAVETAVVGLADRGVRSSIVRLPTIAHGTTDRAGFLPGLIALAREKGFAGYPAAGTNLWGAVHVRDVASLFRLALERGQAGRCWHAIEDGGIPFREIADAIGSRLGLPTSSVPADALMLPGHFGMFSSLVTMDLPASNLITRRTLGWEPVQPRLLDDLDNGNYFAGRLTA